MGIYMKTFKNAHCLWIVYPDYSTVKPSPVLGWEKADYYSWARRVSGFSTSCISWLQLQPCSHLAEVFDWPCILYTIAAPRFKELVCEAPHWGPEESGGWNTRGRVSMLLLRTPSRPWWEWRLPQPSGGLSKGGSRGQNPVFPVLCRALLWRQRVTVERGKDRKLASVPDA